MKALALVLVCACSVPDPLGRERGSAGDDRAAYCAGSGPPILVGDGKGATDVCSGELAQTTFRYALCTCDDYVTSFALATDSFSAAAGPYMPGGKGGSVGTNGGFSANGAVTLGGALWVGGASGARAASLTVAGELRDQGPLNSAGAVAVDHDGFVGASVDVQDLTVGGTLTLPAAATLTVHGTQMVGQLVRAPVTVAAPCGCAPSDVVDIAGYVAAHRGANHDADIGLDPATLDGFGAQRTLALPCGRFYLTRISGGSLTLAAGGRTAVFVDGDAVLTQDLTVNLDPGAELDLFIAGDLSVMGTAKVGSAAQPSRARLYVGGAGSVALGGSGSFGGNFYAPGEIVQAAGDVEVFGSMFVRSVAASAKLTVHYDTDVLGAGDACPGPAPTTCRTCLDCGNQACIGGACGACRDSSDCCAPLVCAAGRCLPQVP